MHCTDYSCVHSPDTWRRPSGYQVSLECVSLCDYSINLCLPHQIVGSQKAGIMYCAQHWFPLAHSRHSINVPQKAEWQSELKVPGISASRCSGAGELRALRSQPADVPASRCPGFPDERPVHRAEARGSKAGRCWECSGEHNPAEALGGWRREGRRERGYSNGGPSVWNRQGLHYPRTLNPDPLTAHASQRLTRWVENRNPAPFPSGSLSLQDRRAHPGKWICPHRLSLPKSLRLPRSLTCSRLPTALLPRWIWRAPARAPPSCSLLGSAPDGGSALELPRPRLWPRPRLVLRRSRALLHPSPGSGPAPGCDPAPGCGSAAPPGGPARSAVAPAGQPAPHGCRGEGRGGPATAGGAGGGRGVETPGSAVPWASPTESCLASSPGGPRWHVG